MEPQRPRRANFQKIAALSSLGLVLPSSIIVGLFLGYWLDKLLGTKHWMLLIFFVLGVASGFLTLIQGIKKYIKEEDEDDGSR